ILIDCNDNKSAKHLLDLRAGVAVERESGRSGNTKIVRCGEHEYPVAATPQYPSDCMHRLARSLRTRTFEDTDADHEVERAIRMPDPLDALDFQVGLQAVTQQPLACRLDTYRGEIGCADPEALPGKKPAVDPRTAP